MSPQQQQLFQAIISGDVDNIRRLIDEDPALVEAHNEQGLSALMLACYHMRPDCISLLRPKRSRLLLCEAAAVGSTDDAQTALMSEPVNTRSPDGFTPLHLAAFFGHADVAEILVRAGAAVNAESENGARLAPLNSAAAGRDAQAALAIALLLLGHGADPNHTQTGGYTPLHSAAANGNTELVHALLNSGADRNRRSADGLTASAFARQRGHKQIAGILET
jgi:ankyrin repeat protein